MASYEVNNDSVGGGGLGFGFGSGGTWGLLIILLLFFSCFMGNKRDDHNGYHDGLHGRFSDCCGTSNCQIDKDVLTSRDAGIIEQHAIYEKNLERKLLERDMVIQEQKNQLFVGGMFAELKESLNCKFGQIEKELERKPNQVPVFAATVDSCTQPQRNCFDRFRDNDKGNDCCFC